MRRYTQEEIARAKAEAHKAGRQIKLAAAAVLTAVVMRLWVLPWLLG